MMNSIFNEELGPYIIGAVLLAFIVTIIIKKIYFDDHDFKI
jgi:hypothetical protein